MHRSFVNIGGIPTCVRTWGRWIEETGRPNEDIIIMFPGNPGLTGYYELFLEKLHNKLGYTCWIIGHAGHEESSNKLFEVPPLKGNEESFTVEAQAKHKVLFYFSI